MSNLSPPNSHRRTAMENKNVAETGKFIENKLLEYRKEIDFQNELKKGNSKKYHWSYDLMISVLQSKIDLLNEIKELLP